MKDAKVALTKWAFVLFGMFAISWWALPFVLKMAFTAITVVALFLLTMAAFILLPAISEWLSMWSWRLWAMAIQKDPVSRLRSDVDAHQRQLEEFETRIAEAAGEVSSVDDVVRSYRNTLTAEEQAVWTAQIQTLKDSVLEMREVHADEVARHEEFEALVKRAEAQYKLGTAFGKAAKVIGARREGPDSLGTSIAFDEVRRQLATSQNKLTMVLKRAEIERAQTPPVMMVKPEPKELPAPTGAVGPGVVERFRAGVERRKRG